MKRYGQYCPIAKAAEILTERWTLLVVRELMMGSSRYNELRRGMPLISPSVLAERLRTLEQHGIVECRRGKDGRSSDYSLSMAGAELQPLIRAVGVWGQRWVRNRMTEQDLDAGLLMWDIHRNIQTGQLPAKRTVVHFEFADAKKGMKHWWLVVENGEVDLCLEDPGYEVDLAVSSDLQSFTRIWMGDISLASARASGKVKLEGQGRLKQTVTKWLGPSPFAEIKAATVSSTRLSGSERGLVQASI
jgi:DNA-binding HxlR family transcriptional regulator